MTYKVIAGAQGAKRSIGNMPLAHRMRKKGDLHTVEKSSNKKK